eukprot:SAG11_NODE_10790_length_805_cov_1.317280_2_plen_100_part_00
MSSKARAASHVSGLWGGTSRISRAVQTTRTQALQTVIQRVRCSLQHCTAGDMNAYHFTPVTPVARPSSHISADVQPILQLYRSQLLYCAERLCDALGLR